MARAVIMPRQGQSVESCIITRFPKKPGDAVKAGEILFTYETDKATFEEECPADGVLLAVFFEEGDDVPCLANVCVIGEAGEDPGAFAPQGANAGPGASAASKAPEASVDTAGAAIVSPGPAATGPAAWDPSALAARAQSPAAEPPRISPRARALADRHGVPTALAVGTGPQGRVIERDVRALMDSGPLLTSAARTLPGDPSAVPGAGSGIGGRTTVDDLRAPMKKATPEASATPVAAAPQPTAVPTEIRFRDEPLSGVRKAIGRAMRASLGDMAQLTHTASFDATDLLALRKRTKTQGEALGLSGVTINDIVLFAVARTLPDFPALNAHRAGDSMRFFEDVHLGVAVDTPRGLLVPTVFFANRLSLRALSAQVKELSAQCQSGAISPDALRNGTFTVSNLGSLGIEHFTPVINPPQTGILGVNTITERPRTGTNGIELYPCMTLSLTYDHCALDGAPASRFLQALCGNLERITLLLAV